MRINHFIIEKCEVSLEVVSQEIQDFQGLMRFEVDQDTFCQDKSGSCGIYTKASQVLCQLRGVS
jgi:hypothetical protein